MGTAISGFDAALPGLKVMRDVGEHSGDYALDQPRRHRQDKTSPMLEVGTWDGTTYEWLHERLNVEQARDEARILFEAIRASFRTALAAMGGPVECSCPKADAVPHHDGH